MEGKHKNGNEQKPQLVEPRKERKAKNPYENLGIFADLMWEWDQYFDIQKKP